MSSEYANSSGGGGGTFCRFTVGQGSKGASVRHLRYIARAEAVGDQGRAVLLWNLPVLVPASLLESLPSSGFQGQTVADYAVLTKELYLFAKTQEAREIQNHRSRGKPRTHYRAILSFEADPGIELARQALLSWLKVAFPQARAAAFFHQNTGHLHAHVWIAARQTDGRKINLDARAFRQIDEAWNRQYSRALGIPEKEHLQKKWQTERHKSLRRAGQIIPGQTLKPPARVGHSRNRLLFTERERQRLGAYDEVRNDVKNEVKDYELKDYELKDYERIESRACGNQWPASRNLGNFTFSEPAASSRTDGHPPEASAVRGEPEKLRDTLNDADHALQTSERALSATHRIYAETAQLSKASAALASRLEHGIDPKAIGPNGINPNELSSKEVKDFSTQKSAQEKKQVQEQVIEKEGVEKEGVEKESVETDLGRGR